MDPTRFDALVRAATHAGSRRGLLGGFAAAALAPLVAQAKPSARGKPPAACKAPGAGCHTHADCCATPCHKKSGKASGRCKPCASGATYCNGVCCAPGEGCVAGACTCDGVGCSHGCCANGKCVSPPTDAQCGTNGSACAACKGHDTCGGGGASGVCGCTPDNAAACKGKNCGSVTNNCGQTVSCGTCTSPQDTCSGGNPGKPNVCGCTPRCGPGIPCGTDDYCGSTCGNGDCSSGQRCNGEFCICDAQSCPGCCGQRSSCLPGTSDTACGAGGITCQTCGECTACDGTRCAPVDIGAACAAPDGGTDAAVCSTDGRCCVPSGGAAGGVAGQSCLPNNCCSLSCLADTGLCV